jgi:6-phosphogluconolactonase/glucosamine-6-phosphate isomerase/deaminase
MHGESSNSEQAAVDYAADLAGFFGAGAVPRFDLILLGMGSDGHCASLFPNTRGLAESARWVVVNEPGLQPFVPRITITLPVINSAANVLFMVAGADKTETVVRVLTGPKQPNDLPSQAVHSTDGTLTWLLDRAAAAGLPA